MKKIKLSFAIVALLAIASAFTPVKFTECDGDVYYQPTGSGTTE